MAQYKGMNADSDNFVKVLLTTNSSRLAVFAASLQWTEVKIVSREHPDLDVGYLGNFVVGEGGSQQ